MEKKTEKGTPFYLTAPIYYPSANLHIGNTYTSIICDAVRRYKKEQGYDAYYVTGSDEHGEKLARVAQEHNMTPEQYIDPIVQAMHELWALLDVEPDRFVRSTSEQHEKDVQALFTELYEKGDIYKGAYHGYYCTPCEAFWTESQLHDGCCPDCGRPVEYREEESYFFRLSKYQDRLLAYYKEHPEFVEPGNRLKEMLGSFFREGLEDLSVTRRNLTWGVPVPFDSNHVIYVWIDALICYLTGIGFGEDPEQFQKFWPADVHFIGRDISRFHTIIWPALLMALDMPLPKQVVAHGWLLFEGDKMSKSKGNTIYPEPLVERYGRDPLKYFVLREFSFGADGNFSLRKFLQRMNSDLANDLGNLLSRTLAMVEKYNAGQVAAPSLAAPVDEELKNVQKMARTAIDEALQHYDFQAALEALWSLIRRTNKYIDETEPWVLAKNEDMARLDTVLYRLIDSLRTIATLLRPFMPETAERMAAQLNIELQSWESASEVDLYPVDTKVEKGEALFPRLDVEKEMDVLFQANDELAAKRQGITVEELRQRREQSEEKTEVQTPKEQANEQGASSIDESKALEEAGQQAPVQYTDIETVDSVKIRIGEVIDCKAHPKADRLLVETVDFGDEVRTIVSGIRGAFEPEELIGKKLAFIVNLPPRKIRGIESNGMILAASLDEKDEQGRDKLSPLTLLRDLPKGTWIS